MTHMDIATIHLLYTEIIIFIIPPFFLTRTIMVSAIQLHFGLLSDIKCVLKFDKHDLKSDPGPTFSAITTYTEICK